MKKIELTLGWNETIRIQKDSKLKENCNLDELVKRAEGKDKKDQPAIWVCGGLRSEWKGSNCCFVDLDTEKGVEDILLNWNEVFLKAPYCYGLQKSKSDKLHAILYIDYCEKLEDWNKKCEDYTFAFIDTLCCISGYNYFNIPGAVDCHNINYAQGLYVSSNPFIINPYCHSFNLAENPEVKYEVKSKREVVRASSIRNLKVKNSSYNPGRKTIDRNFYWGGYNGNELRYRLVANALVYFKDNVEETENYIIDNFNNTDELLACLRTFEKSKKHYKYYDKCFDSFFNRNNIRLEEDQYISDYQKELKDRFTYIQAGCGTGKTEWAKNWLKNNEKTALIQFNYAIRDGKSKGVENYLCQFNDDSRIFDNINKFVGEKRNWEEWTIIIDEAHFFCEYVSIKENEILAILKILEKAGKVVFISGTPGCERDLFNFTEIKYTKENESILKFQEVRYNEKEEIIEFIKAQENKGVLFTNRQYSAFDDLLEGVDFCRFRSDERPTGEAKTLNEKRMQEILKENKISDYNLILATKYLGVGVEIKGVKEVNVYFDLSGDNFTADFMQQCIGRFRDADFINIYGFTKETTKYGVRVDSEVLDIINNPIIGEKYNILSERLLGIDLEKATDKLYGLAKANVIQSRKKSSLGDVIIALKDSYTTIKEEELKNLSPVKEVAKRKYDTSDPELISWILGEGKDILFSQDFDNYNKVLEIAPYKNRERARNTLKEFRSVYHFCQDIQDLTIETLGYLNNNASLLCDMINAKRTYDKINNGNYILSGENVKLKKDLEKVNTFFSDSYLKTKNSVDLENINGEWKFIVTAFRFNSLQEYKSSISGKINNSNAKKKIVYEGKEFDSVNDLKAYLKSIGKSERETRKIVKMLSY